MSENRTLTVVLGEGGRGRRSLALLQLLFPVWIIMSHMMRGCQAFIKTATTAKSLARKRKQHQLGSSSSSALFLSTTTTTTTTIPKVQSRSHLFPTSRINNVMAPMVAASDYPYRCLLRQYGVDLCYTQMMHAKNLVRDKKFRETHIDLEEVMGLPTSFNDDLITQQQKFLGDLSLRDPTPHQQQFLKGPLMVQLAGSTPTSIVEAASVVLDQAPTITGIDLNLGCPQGIARKGNYGAFLCEYDFDNVCNILTELSRYMETNHPTTMVSAKIRLPPTDDVLIKQRIPRLVETGISFLTIHGRTIHENKNKARECHVDRIKLAIETAHQIVPNFPVVANGGVETYDDVVSIQQETNAVAVMSSEAILETPNVFCPDYITTRQTPRQRLQQQFQFANQYLDWCQVCPPLPGVLGNNGSFHICRGHIFKFLHRYIQENHDVRDKLSGHNALSTLQDARDIVNELESLYDQMDDDELEACESSKPNSSWYRRHWDSMGIVHTRQFGGATSPGNDNNNKMDSMSIEEKKALLRKRISKLKEQRLMKTETATAGM